MFRSVRNRVMAVRRPRTTLRRRVPRLEAMEERTLLSVYTVTNLADSGPGSLRAAILQANSHPGADTINFAKGLSGTLTLSTGALSISDALTIQGPGVSKLTIDAHGGSRVFEVTPALMPTAVRAKGLIATPLIVTMSGLTLTGGSVTAPNLGPALTSAGGAILDVGGVLNLNNVTIFDNHVSNLAPFADPSNTGVAEGGAIAVYNGALNITNGIIGKNTVGGTTALGGGIFAAGSTVSISKSTYVGQNTATGILVAAGGGIDLDQSSMLRMDGGRIDSNVAQATGGPGTSNNPWAGEAVGGGLAITGNSTAVLTNVLVTGNGVHGGLGADGATDVAGGDGGTAFGGGLFVTAASPLVSSRLASGKSSLTVTSSTIQLNKAVGGDGGFGGQGANGGKAGGGFGGGIAVEPGGVLNLTSGTVKYNQAVGGTGGAGGTDGTGGDGQASGGGGISLVSGTASINKTTFQTNYVVGGDGGEGNGAGNGGNGGANGGGAIFAQSSILSAASVVSRLTVANSKFTGNLAEGGWGGSTNAAGAGGSGGQAFGGAIAVSAGVTASIGSSTFKQNTVVGGTGGDGTNGGDGGQAAGGGLANLGFTTLANSTFDGNLVGGGEGGYTTVNDGSGFDGVGGGAYGGAVYNSFSSVAPQTAALTVSGGSFTNNIVHGGSGTIGGDGLGGGFYNTGTPIGGPASSTATLKNLTVTKNSARGGVGLTSLAWGHGIGGGLYILNGGVKNAGNVKVTKNDATTSNPDIFGTLS